MSDKSAQEIQDEIKALEACKAYAPHFSMFGDDNHRNIDLEIEALKGEIDTTTDEFLEDYTDDQRSSIENAIEWLEGREDEAPSSGWDSFKPKAEKLPLKHQGCACRRQPSGGPNPGKKC
jgi:hypothetical protein